MAIHKIPIGRLSPEALQGVIGEFISREATDYGEREAAWESKFRQVKSRLENGSAVLVYDDDTETTGILLKDDPALRMLDEVV